MQEIGRIREQWAMLILRGRWCARALSLPRISVPSIARYDRYNTNTCHPCLCDSLSRSVSLWLSYEFNVVVCDLVVVKWLVAFAGSLCGESCLSCQLRPLDPNTEPEIEKQRFAVVERREIVFRLWYWKKIRAFGVVEGLSKLKMKN